MKSNNALYKAILKPYQWSLYEKENMFFSSIAQVWKFLSYGMFQ